MISMYGAWLASPSWAVDRWSRCRPSAHPHVVFGILVYYVLVRRVIASTMHAQIFATFGLMVFLQAGAQFLFGAALRRRQELAQRRRPPRRRDPADGADRRRPRRSSRLCSSTR